MVLPIKIESATEPNVEMIEVIESETKPLAAELNRYNCRNSNGTASPLITDNPALHADGQAGVVENPLASIECHETEAETNEFGKTAYKCRDCGRCFEQRGHFFEHKLIHSNERAFECSLCHKK